MRIRRLIAGVGCGLGLLAPPAAHAAVPTQNARQTLQAAARLPAGAQVTGALPAATPLTLSLSLTPPSAAALDAYVATISTPGSSAYHHFLTVAQFAARFGASGAEVQELRAALIADGLHPGALAGNRLSLAVSGTSATLGAALATDLVQVRLADGDHAYLDPQAPSLPTDIAPLVSGVVGLDTVPVASPTDLRQPPSGARIAAPRLAGAGPGGCAGATTHGTTAPEIGSAYGLSGLWSAGDLGAGTTVALFELEPFSAADVAAYQSCYGTAATVSIHSVDGGAGTGIGSGEAALDVEDVAGLAPAAAIKVYEAPNSASGVLDAYQAIVTDDTAKVVSTSWGECESAAGSPAVAERSLFAEAAVQGQTVFAASGDTGADDCGDHGSPAVDDPASQVDVTAVGGTSLPSYLAPSQEPVWDDAGGAGGGGVSTLSTRPSWQAAAAIPQTAVRCAGASTSCREVPDVAADADPTTGYPVYWHGAWHQFGGTSAAAPTWAALLALADAAPACAGTPVGFLDPILYGLPESDFYDVTSGSNSFDGVTGYTAATGYDMASGLGAPNGAQLVPALCGTPDVAATSAPPGSSSTTAPTATVTAPTATAPTATAPTATAPTTTATATAPTPTAPTAPTATAPTTPTSPSGTGSSGTPATGSGRRQVVLLDVPVTVRGHAGRALRLRLRATDRLHLRLRWTASGLPAGLHIATHSGIVSGIVRGPGRRRVTVEASDAAGNAVSVVIHFVIAAPTRR